MNAQFNRLGIYYQQCLKMIFLKKEDFFQKANFQQNSKIYEHLPSNKIINSLRKPESSVLCVKFIEMKGSLSKTANSVIQIKFGATTWRKMTQNSIFCQENISKGKIIQDSMHKCYIYANVATLNLSIFLFNCQKKLYGPREIPKNEILGQKNQNFLKERGILSNAGVFVV